MGKLAPQWRQFESLVGELERLLSSRSARVSCPGFVIDKQGQRRQVDVLIEVLEGGKMVRTGVECRRRRKTESQMWIEELVGRRQNLGLDLLVAVTRQAVSEPARRAVAMFGIRLMTLSDVSAESLVAGMSLRRARAKLREWHVTSWGVGIDPSGFSQPGLATQRVDENEPVFLWQGARYSIAQLFHIYWVEPSERNGAVAFALSSPGPKTITLHPKGLRMVLPDGSETPVLSLSFEADFSERTEKLAIEAFDYRDAEGRVASVALGKVPIDKDELSAVIQVSDTNHPSGTLLGRTIADFPLTSTVTDQTGKVIAHTHHGLEPSPSPPA